MRALFGLLLIGLTAGQVFALEITTDTLWTGERAIGGNLFVRRGATLRISAGTTVSLASDASIFVFGRLVADGTATAPIHFTRAGHRNGIGRWGKIELTSATGENRFRHCKFHYGNGLRPTSGGLGVISAHNARLLVEDSVFYYFLGDCAYIAEGSTATLRRCYFSTGGEEIPGTGGGQGVTSYFSWVVLDSCVFAFRKGRFDGADLEGQGFNVWVHDCLFLGSDLDDGLDLDNSDAIVERCWFFDYMGSEPGWESRCGGLTMSAGGTRLIRNCIFVNCRQGIISKGETRPFIANCTFYRCVNDIAAYEALEFPTMQVGHPVVRNCILWGTTSQSLVLGWDSGSGSSSTVDIDYCIVDSTATLFVGDPRVRAGRHIFHADPLFANPATTMTANPDFHLRSSAGRWDPRAAGGRGAWVIDFVHSPGIDAGDPASVWSFEPPPNGSRINLGAYGNTPEASKSIYSTPARRWMLY
ncbi:MAG: hypothetical protein N3D11_11975 [Candidatus Sumerlaeia bacterium]|nr:hypothetical protein [Candidatus Sumerlaeia bacterium]